MVEKIEVLVDGGNATPGPPLGPVLGPLGVNIMEIVKVINEKTKNFKGMKVPVKLTIDTKTNKFEVVVGTPPTSALILKELGIEKGSGSTLTTKVGNLTMQQLKNIASTKEDTLLATGEKHRLLEILGTCTSMGIKVDDKDPKEVQKEIKEGKYDKELTD